MSLTNLLTLAGIIADEDKDDDGTDDDDEVKG